MEQIERLESGLRLVRMNAVHEETPVVKLFSVRGDNGDVYKVTKDKQGNWDCSCKDFKFRTNRCKHVFACIMKEEVDVGL